MVNAAVVKAETKQQMLLWWKSKLKTKILAMMKVINTSHDNGWQLWTPDKPSKQS